MVKTRKVFHCWIGFTEFRHSHVLDKERARCKVTVDKLLHHRRRSCHGAHVKPASLSLSDVWSAQDVWIKRDTHTKCTWLAARKRVLRRHAWLFGSGGFRFHNLIRYQILGISLKHTTNNKHMSFKLHINRFWCWVARETATKQYLVLNVGASYHLQTVSSVLHPDITTL